MKDQEKSKQQLIKELQTLRKQIKDAQEIVGDKELLRLMTKQMPAVLWTTDKSLRFTASLGAGLSALNLKANQVVNMTLYEYFQTRDATFLPIAAHLKALQGKSISYEFEWQNNAYQVHIEPLRDIAGQLIGTIGIAHDITVRKHAVEALQESEERFRQLIERLPDGIYRSTPEGKLLAANSALVKMLGYESKEELLKLDISKDLYFNPEERQGVLLKFRKDAIASNIFRLKKKDGNELWVEDHVQPIYNSKGQLLYYDGVLRDITKRKQAEEALRESEKHYRLFFEEDLSGNIISTPEGKLLSCNPAFVRMLGFDSVEEALHTDMFNIYTNRKERDKYLQLLTKKKRLVNYERELVRKDGKKIWVISNIVGVFDENNELVKIRGYIFDITRYKQAEQALRQSEERFRDLFDNAPDMYIILDPNATVLDFNKRGLKQLGYAANQIIGKSITDFIHPEDLEQAGEVMNIIHKTNKAPKNIEVRLLNSRGEFLWVSKEFSLLQTAEGKLQAIRVVCRDITESKRLKEELARSQRLETAGRVAGQIAHDFNNLLAPLTAYPALISEDLAADHPVMEMVEEMESAAHKIAEINQQLLALGRRGHYPMEPIDLNELIQKVFYAHTVPKQIVLQKDLAMDLLLIKGGAAQLTRALTNIIINAIEAMQGIGVLNVRTENVYLDEPLHGYQTIQRGEYVKLEISDSGTGIEPEIFDKIFEPFFTTKKMDRMRGSGLGLSVVHSIMEDHKGYLTVDTLLGQGTSFALYFPITRELTITKGDSILKSKRGHEKILVVDDDPVQRRVVKQLLTRLGYQVQTVVSGEEAIAHLKEQAQDLLILDMVMEGMDGAETYRQILAFQPLQKAIILSGYAMSQRVDEALRLGADSFISKPVILNDLATAVRQALDNTTKLKHAF